METKFYVNEKKRTVVCVIKTVNDIPQKLAKYGFADDQYDGIDELKTYIGFAYCAPEDEWDENYGRHLAEYRASRERQIDVNNTLKAFIKDVSRRIDNLYDYGLLRDPHFPFS